MADSPKVPLGNKPNATNWIEKYRVLEPHATNWIYRAAEHLKGKGMPDGEAVATAKNAAAKMCASGDTNLPGIQQVNPGSRAEACAAVAKWDAARAKAKAEMTDTEWAEWRKVELAGARIYRRIIELTAEGDAVELSSAANRRKSRSVLEQRVYQALKQRPELKGKPDAVLRAAAARGAKRAQQRRTVRQRTGTKDVRVTTAAQQEALRHKGLLGRKGKATVIQHTLTRGKRKGQTIFIRVSANGRKWSEVKKPPTMSGSGSSSAGASTLVKR